MTRSIWREIQKENFRDWKKLFDFLQLDAHLSSHIIQRPRFPLNLPRRLAEKITPATLEDPILRQFLPRIEEHDTAPGFIPDPVNDRAFLKESKLLHKYAGRALLVCTSACAMHCRYCFRQHFDYDTSDALFEDELQALRDDTSIKEIILSGGDPLSLGNAALRTLLSSLSAIPHLNILRFHTRFPIGIPERIDNEFLALLRECRLQTFVVIHCNHPKELDETIISSLKQIQKLGIPVLNQAVLLKGVNDSIETLQALCETLIAHGILPYYLHQLDEVQGAAHFETAQDHGLSLIEALRQRLPGYAVPRYVKEIPGKPHKTLLS